MPVLKVKNNGVWEDVYGTSEHTHEINDITDFPTSLPANGGDADTLDGMHAKDFAIASDVENLKTLVGDTPVSEQIASSGVSIDTTLTQSGMAADAKTVGEALALKADQNLVDEISERIPELDDELKILGAAADAKAVGDRITTLGILNPDIIAGENGEILTTDSEKLQRCFDILSTSGGVISINRVYTLTSNINVSHNSSSNNNLITVAGVGKQAGINFGAYCFQGADTPTRAYGGIIFKDLWLTGTGVGFNCNYLIRLTFDNCMIRNFSNFLYCTDCLQSVYFMGCYIRASSSSVADGSVKETIKSTTACDLKIIGCVAEQGYGLLNVTDSMDGCSITDSCIEGYKNIPIILPVSNRAVNISNNYFEANNGTNIDATAATGAATISICNNLFCEYHDEDEYSGVIKLPVRIDNGYMNVSNNHCNYAYTILLLVPDGATDLSKVYAFGNYGATNDTRGLIKMVTPTDVHKALEGIVKGEDYWTEEDKTEMVNDVLAAMSGEEWTFTLSDGTTFKRTVATASLTEFTSEAWTFTLADGTTINKEVSIV